MKPRLALAALLLSLLATTAQAVLAAPSGPREAAAACLALSPLASAVNMTGGCTASLTCPNGTPISCSSSVPGTCTSASYFVDCNGARTNCPIICSIQSDCGAYCEGSRLCRLGGLGGVTCDGLHYSCPGGGGPV